MSKLTRLTATLNLIALKALGRDRLDYLCSNTYNNLTKRLNPLLYCFELKAQVLQRRQETPDVVSFKLLPNQYWQAPQAGQFIELTYLVDGQKLERAYSISEVQGNSFWITVKRQGQMSGALHEQLQPGELVSLRGPFGQFVYQQQASVLLICAGSGITPCYAILRQLMELAERPQIQFYAQFSSLEDTIFASELQRLQQQQPPGLKLDLAYSQEPNAGSVPALSRDLDSESFVKMFPDYQQRDIYLCGPEGFKQQIISVLDALNYPAERLYLEHFVPQTVNLPGFDILPEVYFCAENCRIQLQPDDLQKSLLELGLEHGLNLEKGCQKGYCGSCKLVLHEGEVYGQTQGKAVYLCSAYAKSERVVLGP